MRTDPYVSRPPTRHLCSRRQWHRWVRDERRRCAARGVLCRYAEEPLSWLARLVRRTR